MKLLIDFIKKRDVVSDEAPRASFKNGAFKITVFSGSEQVLDYALTKRSESIQFFNDLIDLLTSRSIVNEDLNEDLKTNIRRITY